MVCLSEGVVNRLGCLATQGQFAYVKVCIFAGISVVGPAVSDDKFLEVVGKDILVSLISHYSFPSSHFL